MARLQTVLDAVQTRVNQLMGVTVTYRTGHKYLGEKILAPRVIWVPGKDKFGAATDGRQTRPKAVRTRGAEVYAHCFHDDFGDCEELVNAVVYGMHAVAHGSYTVSEGEWSQPEWLERGHVCSLRFVIDIPVTAPTPTVATITAVAPDNTNTVQGDGFIDVGEST